MNTYYKKLYYYIIINMKIGIKLTMFYLPFNVKRFGELYGCYKNLRRKEE